MNELSPVMMFGAFAGPVLATVFGLAIAAVVARQFQGAWSGVLIGVIAGGGAMIAGMMLFSILFAASVVDFGELQQQYENTVPQTEQSN